MSEHISPMKQASNATLTQGLDILTNQYCHLPCLLYSQQTCDLSVMQDIDPQMLQQGDEALMKIQITHCDESQTLLGITMAHVLAGTPGTCCHHHQRAL